MASIVHHFRLLARWLRSVPPPRAARLWNWWRVFLATRRKPECLSCYPYTVQIEATAQCNYACPDCGGRLRRAAGGGGAMAIERYAELLTALRGRALVIDFTGQGESFLHPRIHEMIRLAVDAGFYTRVETNGSCMEAQAIIASGLHHLHLALDGMSAETYRIYRRGGDFAAVRRNLEEIVALSRAAGRPYIEARFLVFRHNEHEVEEARRYFQALGIAYTIAAPYLPHGFAEANTYLRRARLEISADAFAQWSSTKAEYIAYVHDSISGHYRHRSLAGVFRGCCTAPWGGLNIRWDGSVIPCCHMLNEDIAFGNIFTDGFPAVWNGPRFRDFRRRAATSFSSLAPCASCPVNFA